MNKPQEISDYKILGYSDKDLNELKDREIAIKNKKRELEDILDLVSIQPNLAMSKLIKFKF